MKSRVLLKFLLGVIVLGGASNPARAQWRYPGGYGGYGWGGWGADPASGRMAGLGAFARGEGSYTLDKAKADAIERKSLISWNQALQARNRALRIEKDKQDAKDQAEADVRNAAKAVVDGTTLNDLLEQILNFNAGQVEAYLTKVPLSSRLIRDIPFQPASESITFCINDLLAEDAVPVRLREERYAPQLDAVRKAVRKLLDEDEEGQVTDASRKALTTALNDLHESFDNSNFGGDIKVDEYLATVASLNVLLQDSSMKQALALLDTYEKGSVGDLIGFMEAFNLQFGPAVSETQKDTYRNLVPLLTQVRDKVAKDEQKMILDQDGKSLQAAAKDAFKGMTWEQIDAQARGKK